MVFLFFFFLFSFKLFENQEMEGKTNQTFFSCLFLKIHKKRKMKRKKNNFILNATNNDTTTKISYHTVHKVWKKKCGMRLRIRMYNILIRISRTAFSFFYFYFIEGKVYASLILWQQKEKQKKMLYSFILVGIQIHLTSKRKTYFSFVSCVSLNLWCNLWQNK